MPKSKRVTKIEKEKRERQVQKWIIAGESDHDIIRKVVKKWELTSRMAKNYVDKAYKGFKKDQDIDVETKRAAKIAELKDLIRGMDAKYKITPAGVNAIVRVQKQIIRLEGTEAPRKHEIENNLNQVIKPTKYVDATNGN